MSALAASAVVRGDEARVIIAGARLWLSDHAVERYVERVRPTMAFAQALEELRNVLAHAHVTPERPGFLSDVAAGEVPDGWVVLGEVAFPVQAGRLTTCLLPGFVTDGQRRMAKERRRRARSMRRKEPRSARGGGDRSNSGGQKLREVERRYSNRKAAT